MLDDSVDALVVTDWHEFAALDDEFVVDTISRIFIAPLALPKSMSAASARDIPRPQMERYGPESSAVRRQMKA